MTENTYSLCEAVADIADHFSSALIVSKDSREICRLVIEWAEIFQSRHENREWDGEYLEEIEKFFAEQYGAWLEMAGDTRASRVEAFVTFADAVEAHLRGDPVNLAYWIAKTRYQIAIRAGDQAEAKRQASLIDEENRKPIPKKR